MRAVTIFVFQSRFLGIIFIFYKTKIKVPSAYAVFPHKIPTILTLEKLLQHEYVNLVRATEMTDDGHFFEMKTILSSI